MLLFWKITWMMLQSQKHGSNLTSLLVSISGYTMFAKSCTGKGGWGIALYINQQHASEQLALWIKMCPYHHPRSVSHLIIAVVYYPPDSPVADLLHVLVLNHLHNTFNNILSNYPHAGIAIMRDFNQLNLKSLLADPKFKQIVR